MAGIRATGKMDAQTVRMMELPRCGVEDTVGAFTMGSDGKNLVDCSIFLLCNMQQDFPCLKLCSVYEKSGLIAFKYSL